jgi:hypothetical protein
VLGESAPYRSCDRGLYCAMTGRVICDRGLSRAMPIERLLSFRRSRCAARMVRTLLSIGRFIDSSSKGCLLKVVRYPYDKIEHMERMVSGSILLTSTIKPNLMCRRQPLKSESPEKSGYRRLWSSLSFPPGSGLFRRLRVLAGVPQNGFASILDFGAHRHGPPYRPPDPVRFPPS